MPHRHKALGACQVLTMVVKPYQETQVAPNIKHRTFTEDADNSDLCWHRDAEDPTVRVLEGEGWSP